LFVQDCGILKTTMELAAQIIRGANSSRFGFLDPAAWFVEDCGILKTTMELAAQIIRGANSSRFGSSFTYGVVV
jgi:HD-like signal output (HDOD) protein